MTIGNSTSGIEEFAPWTPSPSKTSISCENCKTNNHFKSLEIALSAYSKETLIQENLNLHKNNKSVALEP